jgi:hypothetical protein
LKGNNHHSLIVYVIEAADRSKPVDVNGFKALLANPPGDIFSNASSLMEKERAHSMGKNVTIMKLERKDNGYRHYSRRDGHEMVWRDAGKFVDFDASKTYYYVPLSGYQMQSSHGYSSSKDLFEDVNSLPGLFSGEIYGVRKMDIETISLQKNWVNLESFIANKLTSTSLDKILISVARTNLDNADILSYNNNEIAKALGNNSPYAKFVNQFKGVDKFTGRFYNVERLFKNFAGSVKMNVSSVSAKYQKELDNVNSRYPLLSSLNSYRVKSQHIADYINLVDAKEGIV